MASARFVHGLLSVLAVLALQSEAAGQGVPNGGSADATIAYSAPASCPGASSWIDEVLSRLSSDARERGRRQLPALVEGLEVAADGQRALLRLRGAASARVVVGQGCSEVLAGAALIAAVALGPDLDAEPSRMPLQSGLTEPRSVAAPSHVTASASAPEPSAASAALEPSAERPAAAREGEIVATDRGEQPPAQAPAAAPRWAIGAGAGAHTGIGPSPAGVLDGTLELAWPDRGWSVRGRGSLGLAGARVAERSARFLFIGGGFDVCALTFGVHLGWQWRSCLGVQLGRVQAEGDAGSELARAEKHRTWWAAPELLTRLQSPRLRGVRFELEGGLGMPLWHRVFEFHDPEVSVFETPSFAASARLGLQVPLE